jgi:hypothetical protein
MSKVQAVKSYKVCCTCALWDGERTLDIARVYITSDSNNYGTCMGGAFYPGKTPPTASCNQHQTWPALR